ncbi:IS66 family insertion sequence element accessory protein TnpB [Sphingobacterium kitahiroshimense]|uniref:IS66 family insertion sequence element accessory protein TnpB n=1 Tax=Sphingobacterium kitahiroshimense TaxID=470446 RepID=A0ABV0BPY6_9SPHI
MGLVLYYKRLESGTFATPKNELGTGLQWSDLALMMEGIPVMKSIQKKASLFILKISFD